MSGREPVIARFGAPIALPAAASSMATDPSSGLLYAVDGPGGAVSVIDERTKTVLGTPIELGIPLGAIAMDPLTHRAFVASSDPHLVVVIDELTGRSERQSIALPARPTHLATSAPGAVVAILDNGTAVTIDARRLALTGDPIVLGGVVKPDASVVASAHRLYVADVDRRAVLTADLDAHSVIHRSERIAISPVQLHVDAASNSLLVRDGDGRCVRLDLATDRELDRLELGSAVSASVFDVRSGTLYLVAAERLVQVAGTPRLAEISSTSLATSTDRGGGALLAIDDGSGVVFAAAPNAGTVTAFQRR
jgi:DNA-binding beta-propeller fold protein YncE